VRPCAGVVTVHDLAFEAWPEDFAGRTRWKYRRLARAAARSAERVICPSRFTAEDVTRRWGIDPARIRVVPEAPALPAGRLPEPPGPYVLAVGDLRRKKNLEALVRAFVAVRTRAGVEHRLLLAGLDAGSGQQLRAVAAGAPVALLGYVGDEQLDALIRGADLLVHPSLYEGFGLVVLEAMARGTPVLAARATALPETGGDAAAYFEPAEPAALADALERLLTDRSLRDALAQRGLARAASFSWREAARATAEVYREVL
jgi:glycosyltransferase involved in cell wall biosynthesis